MFGAETPTNTPGAASANAAPGASRSKQTVPGTSARRILAPPPADPNPVTVRVGELDEWP